MKKDRASTMFIINYPLLYPEYVNDLSRNHGQIFLSAAKMARPGTVRKIYTVSILIREYLHEFLKKFEMVQLGYSGAGEN